MCHSGSILNRTPTLKGSPGLIAETLASDSAWTCCFFSGVAAATQVDTASTGMRNAAARILDAPSNPPQSTRSPPGIIPPCANVFHPKGYSRGNKDTVNPAKLRHEIRPTYSNAVCNRASDGSFVRKQIPLRAKQREADSSPLKKSCPRLPRAPHPPPLAFPILQRYNSADFPGREGSVDDLPRATGSRQLLKRRPRANARSRGASDA